MPTKKRPHLRAVRIQIRDVLGLSEFGIEPGRINVIGGKNGLGKSSILKAIESTLGGGSLARLARIDPTKKETEPEVVLVLAAEDGSEAYRVSRTADGVKVKARVGDTAGFKDVDKPQAWLRSLYDGLGSNPVPFLTAKDADRATMLLEAIPLEFDRAALYEAMGLAQIKAMIPPPPTGGLHPLQEIGLIRDAVFETRTGVNRDEKAKRSSADQMRQSAPAAPPEDLSARILSVESRVETLAAEVANAQQRAEEKRLKAIKDAQHAAEVILQRERSGATAAILELKAHHEAWSAERRAALEREIEKARMEMESAIDAIETRRDGVVENTSAETGRAEEEAEGAYDQDLAGVDRVRQTLAAHREELSALREQVRIAEKGRTLYEQALAFEREAEDLKLESDRLTKALAALDEFKLQMAKDLPIKGLEIRGNAIFLNDVPYDLLNTQAKVELWAAVAIARAKGPLKAVFVDGAEALDEEHFEALVTALDKAGVQAFLARVSEGPLEVQTRGLFD